MIVNLNMFITRCSYTDYATVPPDFMQPLNTTLHWQQKNPKLLGFLDTSVYVEA